MPGPWEKYATQAAEGPWSKYAAEQPSSAPSNDPSTYPQGKSAAEAERMRREFLRQEGTLPTRIRNTPPEEAVRNIALEVPRFAQEMVTVPISSAKKGLYGLGALAKTGGSMLRGNDLDTALRTGTEAMQGYTPIQGPLDSSMTGETISRGIENLSSAAESATGDTGFARAGIQAGADVLGLVGGGKVLARGGRSLAELGRTAARKTGQRIGMTPDIEAVKLSEQYKVPITAGEATASPSLKGVETSLERVPIFGTRKFRKGQSEALKTAADDLVQKFDTGVADVPEAIQQSMLDTLKRGKGAAKEAYDKVEAASQNSAPIMPENLKAEASKLLNEYPDVFERLTDTPLKNKLQNIVADTLPTKEVSSIVDSQGRPIITTKPAEVTFTEARKLRESLNNYIDRAYKSAGAVGSNELRQLTRIKEALDTDINTWGESTGNKQLTDAFATARKVYQDRVAPFKDTTVKTATGRQFDTDMLVDKFVKNDRPQLASKLMNTLDENGKQLVRYSIVKKAMDVGLETKQGVPFSPAKFAGTIEKLGKSIDPIFGKDANLIRGYAKIARIAERAGQYAENPPTGMRVGDYAIQSAPVAATTAAMMGNFAPMAGLISAAGATKLLSYMLTSPRGKSLLIRAAKTPEKNVAAWNAIGRDLSKEIANAGTDETFWSKIIPPKLQEQYGKLRDKLKDDRGLVGSDINYQGAHKPTTVEGGAARLHDLTTAFGDDIYTRNAAQYFGTGDRALDMQTLSILQKLRDKPNALVTVYRAVPKNVNSTKFNIGDWVTVNKRYAKMHGDSTLEGEYKIIEQKVPVKSLTTNADSFHEQGYYPE